MNKLPRKINEEETLGYVLAEFGPLPYANENEKEKLLALSQIYNAALKKGTIVQGRKGTLPQFRGKQGDEDWNTLQVIANHSLKAISHIQGIRDVEGFMKVLYRKRLIVGKKKTISKKKFDKIKGRFS
jgi:hypothetical protein